MNNHERLFLAVAKSAQQVQRVPVPEVRDILAHGVDTIHATLHHNDIYTFDDARWIEFAKEHGFATDYDICMEVNNAFSDESTVSNWIITRMRPYWWRSKKYELEDGITSLLSRFLARRTAKDPDYAIAEYVEHSTTFMIDALKKRVTRRTGSFSVPYRWISDIECASEEEENEIHAIAQQYVLLALEALHELAANFKTDMTSQSEFGGALGEALSDGLLWI